MLPVGLIGTGKGYKDGRGKENMYLSLLEAIVVFCPWEHTGCILDNKICLNKIVVIS